MLFTFLFVILFCFLSLHVILFPFCASVPWVPRLSLSLCVPVLLQMKCMLRSWRARLSARSWTWPSMTWLHCSRSLTSSLLLLPVWTLLRLLAVVLFHSTVVLGARRWARNVMCWVRPPFSKLYLCHRRLSYCSLSHCWVTVLSLLKYSCKPVSLSVINVLKLSWLFCLLPVLPSSSFIYFLYLTFLSSVWIMQNCFVAHHNVVVSRNKDVCFHAFVI